MFYGEGSETAKLGADEQELNKRTVRVSTSLQSPKPLNVDSRNSRFKSNRGKEYDLIVLKRDRLRGDLHEDLFLEWRSQQKY